MKKYTEFLNERKAHKLTIEDNKELSDFLNHVLNNMEEEPNLLRSAYARIQKILHEIRSGNCPKNRLIPFFQTILLFIEGSGNNIESLRKRSEMFLSIDSSEYDVLLSIIHDYNHLVNRFKTDEFRNQVFNIRSWAFEIEGLEPYEEIDESKAFEDNSGVVLNIKTTYKGRYIIHKAFVVDDIDYPVGNPSVRSRQKGEPREKYRLADKLYDQFNKIRNFDEVQMNELLNEISDKVGFSSQKTYNGDMIENVIKLSDEDDVDKLIDILNSFGSVSESKSYEDYCDFGCGYIATYLAENPDIDPEEFEEYVGQHNKADRDSGELQDISEKEIERLGKEFKKK